MSNEVHQKFTAELDAKPYEQGMSRVVDSTKSSSAMAQREFGRIQQSALVAAEKAASRWDKLGRGTQQVSVIGQSLREGRDGMSQLSQSAMLASTFLGPKGLIVAGLIAAGAQLASNIRAQREMAESAKSEAVVRERTADIMARQKAVRDDEQIQKEIAALRLRSQMSEKDAKALEDKAALDERIRRIGARRDLPDAVKGDMINNLRNLASLQAQAQMKQEGREFLRKEGQGILDRAQEIREGGTRAERVREEQRQRQAERRAINERLDEADRRDRNRRAGNEDSMDRARPSGLSREDRDNARNALEHAKNEAKGKGDVNISAESIRQLVDAVDRLLPK